MDIVETMEKEDEVAGKKMKKEKKELKEMTTFKIRT